MNKFILKYIFDIFPSEWQFIYFRIFNFDYVRLRYIKRFNDPFGQRLQFLKKIFDFKQIFIRIFKIVRNCLRRHNHFLQLHFNIALKLIRDVSNSLWLFLWSANLNFEFSCVVSVSNKPIMLSLDFLHLDFNLISQCTPLNETIHVLVNEVLNIIFSNFILLALIWNHNFFLYWYTFLH